MVKFRVLPWIFIICGAIWAAGWLKARQLDEKDRQDNTFNTDVLALPPAKQEEFELLQAYIRINDFSHEYIFMNPELGPKEGWEPVQVIYEGLQLFRRRRGALPESA